MSTVTPEERARPATVNAPRPRSATVTSGLVIVDKPAGWTSHDVVGRMRRLAGTRRVGHAGTLDPLATGVLVVGVEKATRLLHHLVLTDKGYDTTIRLGISTVTDDSQGELIAAVDATAVADEDIELQISKLRGQIMQVPSSVSAIKINGERAYKRARDGEQVSLAARPVTISCFEVLDVNREEQSVVDVRARVECSSGTYVRALARDLGAGLGVGGHLTALRRTRVGPFTLDQARSLDELAELADPVTLPLAAAVATAMPIRRVTDEEVHELGFGRAIAAGHIDGTYAALTGEEQVIALLRDVAELARPVLVFAPRG